MFPWHQYLFAILFILGGANHFRKPKMYERVIPPYIPIKSSVVLLSGIAEMVFGLMLLNPETQSQAAWSIIVMLILFIPVHVYMLQNEKASMKLPKCCNTIIRQPLR